MKRRPFSRFEAFARRLVEEPFGRKDADAVTITSITTAASNAQRAAWGRGESPTAFQIKLHPTDLRQLTSETPNPDVGIQFALAKALDESGRASHPIEVLLVGDSALAEGTISLATEVNVLDESTRTMIDATKGEQAMQAIVAYDAFLIVDGRQHVPLRKTVINIGRHHDNDVVLPDPTVSRQHAQIRWRFGRFAIYDLGSQSGIAVNGRLVKDAVLHDGDIIALSDSRLLFTVNSQHGGDTQHTQVIKPI